MDIKKNGETIENAIVLNKFENVPAEYFHLEMKFGKRGKDWNLKMQYLVEKGNKYYDKMDIVLSDGTEKIIYFDITSFYGKY